MQFDHQSKFAGALVLALGIALAGCRGPTGLNGQDGSQGPAGSTGGAGPAGTAGDPGVNNPGSLALTVKFDSVNGTALGSALPAPGIRCFTNPDFTTNTADAVVEGTTNASGKITLELAAGTYGFQCRPTNADYADTIAPFSVTIAAGQETPRTVTGVNRLNPLYFTTAPSVTGTATPGAQLTVNTGTAAGATTYTVTPVATNLTAVTLNGSNQFDVPALDAILAAIDAGKGTYKGFKLLPRPGLLGFAGTVTRSLTNALAFDVTASDGASHTATARVSVTISGVQGTQGLAVGPLGVNVVADAGTATGPFSWTLTAPNGSSAALQGAATRNPYFTPDVEGAYALVNGSTTINFTAASYRGMADATTSACEGCHGGYAQSLGYQNLADYWSHAGGLHGNHYYFGNTASRAPGASGNSSILQWGLQGGIDYSTTCYSCHSVGSWVAPSVANGGFRSTMTAISPTMNSAWLGDGLDHWTSLDATLKARAGIQCESCHGPASQHAGDPQNLAKRATPWSAEACAVCHDSPAHHDKYNLWSRAAHANLTTAVDEASNELHPGNESCGRCHAVQGFVDYLRQQQNAGASCSSWLDKTGAATTSLVDSNGNPLWAGNLLVKGTPNTAGQYSCRVAATGTSETAAVRAVGQTYLAGIGLTQDQIQAITCVACHEPHSTELRVKGSTGQLAAGFSVDGAGAGAICMICHNGRNGARGDSVTIATVAAPHTPTQTEILLGQNAYWVAGYPSDHAAIEGTCAGCHVTVVPDGVSHNDNHTFKPDETICKACHGSLVTPTALYGQYAQLVKQAQAAMVASLGSSFQIVGSARTVTVTAANGPKITGYGRSGATFTFTTAIDDPNAASGTKTTVTAAANKLVDSTGTAVKANGRFAKAGWNLALVSAQSAAVHNKTFTFQVLAVSAQKVVDPAAGAL